MNPAVTLTVNTIFAPYLYPDNLPPTDIEDWELGGIAISDGSQGLQVQVWHLLVHGSGATTSVWLDAPNIPPFQLFALANITYARLAFDQNMHPVVSYVAGTGPGFYWFDPLIPGNTFTPLPSTVVRPCVCMDDKRPLQTTLGNNDVVMAYVNNGNLCYRLQRERYGTEHVWMTNITSVLANPFVNRIGMDTGFRLLIDVHGALYL